MDQISECRFGHARPKPGYHYPVIRFPQEYQNLIGEQVRIFSTEFEGSQAFLVVAPGIPVRNTNKLINKSDTGLEKRLTVLEQSLSELKELIELKAAKPSSGGDEKVYGPSRIRTGDLRRVKAVS